MVNVGSPVQNSFYLEVRRMELRCPHQDRDASSLERFREIDHLLPFCIDAERCNGHGCILSSGEEDSYQVEAIDKFRVIEF